MDGSLSREATAQLGAKTWDGSGVAHDPATWDAVRRLVKPGGFVLAFSASRTIDYLMQAMRRSGWDVRGYIDWIYGQSFPGVKRLRPSKEPVVVARHGPSGSLPGLPARDVVVTDDVGLPEYFYCHKAGEKERDAGCLHLEPVYAPVMNTDRLSKPKYNPHPTVKPLRLMRWLVRLASGEGGLVLDPFAGSGTTGMACCFEGREFVGVELEPKHAEVARARIAWAESEAAAPAAGEEACR